VGWQAVPEIEDAPRTICYKSGVHLCAAPPFYKEMGKVEVLRGRGKGLASPPPLVLGRECGDHFRNPRTAERDHSLLYFLNVGSVSLKVRGFLIVRGGSRVVCEDYFAVS
jgi:hypothetical protein